MLSEKNRFLRLTIAGMPDTIIMTRLSGREALSTPYTYHATAFIQALALNHMELLGKPAVCSLNSTTPCTQRITGVISATTRQTKQSIRGLDYHQVTLCIEPWFKQLEHHVGYDTYLNKNTLSIIKELLTRVGYWHLVSLNITNTYPPRAYCVRHHESIFHFISRILEEDGIFYYFKHDQSQTHLVLEDEPWCPTPYAVDLTDDPRHTPRANIYAWSATSTLVCDAFHSIEDLAQPAQRRESQAMLTPPSSKTLSPHTQMKQCRYPPAVVTHTQQQLDRTTTLHRQRATLNQKQYRAQSTYLGLMPGMMITLTNTNALKAYHGTYRIKSINHTAYESIYLDHHDTITPTKHYSNHLQLFATNIPFVPEESTPKPNIHTVEEGRVVGKKTADINTNPWGQIKVNMHWNTDKKDNHHALPWVPVCQTMGSHGHGAQFIPRIGQDVAVMFADGNPERPMVCGALANNVNLPAFRPEKTPTQSGFKSHTLNDTQSHHANSLCFDDHPTRSAIYLNAQKDMALTVHGKCHEQVGNTMHITVKNGDQITHSDGTLTIQAHQGIQLHCGQSSVRLVPDNITFSSDTILFDY